jgi:hypothetical protein
MAMYLLEFDANKSAAVGNQARQLTGSDGCRLKIQLLIF